jgi:hypothetical protein
MAEQHEAGPLNPIDELMRRQREIEAAARGEAANLESERVRLIEKRRPFFKLQENRNLLAEKIQLKKAGPTKVNRPVVCLMLTS